jgi:NMD protein affecting ribosome stability and mRNA decay
MARFCPKCGKSIDKGVFCADCKPHVLDYKPSNVKICCVCKKIFTHGSWKATDDPIGLITKEIRSKVKQKDVEVNVIGELPELKPGIRQFLTAEVIQDEVVHEVLCEVEVTYCLKCAKLGTQYFEGVLQIRNISEKSEKIIAHVLSKAAEQGNAVNKVVTHPKGVDYYMTNKRAMPKLAQKIIERAGGFYASSAKLFSHNHQTGKEIYRLNLLLELPDFNIGDVFFFKNKYIIIESFSKKISSRNLLTGKKVIFAYAEFKKIRDKDFDQAKKIISSETTIIRLRPQQEVLHPENYQPVKVLNPLDDAKEDQKVKIILIDKGAIII